MSEQYRVIIDGAFDGIYERIGDYLTQAGLEDASGARRLCVDLFRQGEWDKAARYLQTDALTLRKKFAHLTIFASD